MQWCCILMVQPGQLQSNIVCLHEWLHSAQEPCTRLRDCTSIAALFVHMHNHKHCSTGLLQPTKYRIVASAHKPSHCTCSSAPNVACMLPWHVSAAACKSNSSNAQRRLARKHSCQTVPAGPGRRQVGPQELPFTLPMPQPAQLYKLVTSHVHM